MTTHQAGSSQAKLLNAGDLEPEIGSFRLHLAAESKAVATVRTYTETVRWFAACMTAQDGSARWEEIGSQDVQWWVAELLD